MTICNKTTVAIGLAAVCLLLADRAMAGADFMESLTGGKASANVRLRFEEVHDDAFEEEGEALTLRTRLGYETSPFYGFTTLVEYENVSTLNGIDEYQEPAPPAPKAAGAAVIADPEVNEFNRAQIKYRGIRKLDLTLGRQYISYDNQRWIGNVGFRQDDQTFDAFSASYTGLKDFTLNYAYVVEVNGITPEFDNKVNDHFFNIQYNGFSWGKLTAYHYDLHSQNDSIRGPEKAIDVNPGLRYVSNKTTGLRLDGGYNLPTTIPLRAIYRAELAQQEAQVMEPVAGTRSRETTYHTDYGMAEVGFNWGFGGGNFALTPVLGYEVLSSDNGKYGLQTPYGTKHAFNGFADQFLVTPKEGLVDKYVNIGFDWNPQNIKIQAQYHEYETDHANAVRKGDLDLGKEYSLQVVKTFSPNWSVGTKIAIYDESHDADDVLRSNKRDTDKLWAWVEYKY